MNTNELNIQSFNPAKKLNDISAMLANNPELPDMARDAAPYFSPAARQTILKIAALGEFALKTREVADSFEASANNTNMNEFYSTMKKYVPMNKRNSIDMIMNLMNGMRSSFKPKSASNGLEGIINTLSGIDKISKMISATGDIKRLSGILSEQRSNNSSLDGMVGMVKGLIGNNSVGGLEGLLSALAKK